MNFGLSKDEADLVARAKKFATERVKPSAAQRERDHEFPAGLFKEAAALGFAGCLVPKNYGGSALGNIGQCLVLEEIAAACASTHVTLSVHNSLICGPILKWGDDALKTKYLPRVASGEWLGSYLLTEPGSGSDAASMKTSAVQDGDHWVLNGDKMWITSGDTAQVGVVFARTDLDPAVKAPKAISAFVVEMGLPGVTFGKREEKLGLRSSSTTAVFFKDVRVPKSCLLGEVNKGFNIAMDTLNGGRIGIAVQSVGIARAAHEVLLGAVGKYARRGRPLAQSQLAQWKVSDIATEIDAARLLCWRAAAMRDAGESHIREASMAKLFASRMANNACRAVVDCLGEIGVGDETAAERLFRDCRVTELYEGTTEVQRLVIAKQLLEA